MKDEQKIMKGEQKIRFFNVSLTNGQLASLPKFEPEESFMGVLIREMELTQFSWVQFIFQEFDYSRYYAALRQGLKKFMEIYKDSKESTYHIFSKMPDMMKNIDNMGAYRTVVMAIQGMVISDHSHPFTAFSRFADSIDSLSVYYYRDPRMLLWLVDRMFIADIKSYFLNYLTRREVPPSFVITTNEIPYYIHFPVGSGFKSLSTAVEQFEVEPEKRPGAGGFMILQQPLPAKPGKMVFVSGFNSRTKELDDRGKAALKQLANQHKRTWELVHGDGTTTLYISSDDETDMISYTNQLSSIYGGLSFRNVTNPVPKIVSKIPEMLGLLRQK